MKNVPVLATSLSTWQERESSEKGEPQLRKCSNRLACRLGYWAFSWLIIEENPGHREWCHPWRAVTGCIKKQAEWEVNAFLHGFHLCSSFSSSPEFSQPCTYKSNKVFPLQSCFWLWCLLQQQKASRDGTLWTFREQFSESIGRFHEEKEFENWEDEHWLLNPFCQRAGNLEKRLRQENIASKTRPGKRGQTLEASDWGDCCWGPESQKNCKTSLCAFVLACWKRVPSVASQRVFSHL